jgi:hypothetical protein
MRSIQTKCGNVTWDCAFSGASKGTTQRQDSIRWRRGEAWTNIKQITKKDMYNAFYCLKINIWSVPACNRSVSTWFHYQADLNNLSHQKANFGILRNTSSAHINAFRPPEVDNKMSTAAVFLDIEKAFDTTWHPGLLYKLSKLNFSTRIIKLISLTTVYYSKIAIST